MTEGFARGIALGLAALTLSACATRDPIVSTAHTVPSGNWRIERQTDRITGAPLSSAYLRTRTSSNSAELFPKPAGLQISCFKNAPLVRFSFAFRVGSKRNSMLGYRFDDKPGQDVVNARFLQDYRTVVIEDRNEVTPFVRELATSSMLYIRIRSLNSGRSSAEFRIDGAPDAIREALADCPIAGPPAAPRRVTAG